MFNLTTIENEKAKQIHQESIVVDAHCDTLLEVAKGIRELGSRSLSGHSDVPRMHSGGIDVQFLAAFIESEYKPERSLKRVLQLCDVFWQEMQRNQQELIPVVNYKDIERANRENKIAIVLSVEGGECLVGDLAILRLLYRLGVRSLGLTWNQRNELADGFWESQSGGGLTCFGKQVIVEMNQLGMLVDLAHISEKGFWDAMEVAKKPLLVSHANCYKICQHPRNLTDEQILALAKKGGIIGITFASEFIDPMQANIYRVLDHIDHVAEIAGTECIGLGSDFDGIESTPEGLEDASKYMNITKGLVERGYTKREIKGILGENILRVMKAVMACHK